MILKDIRYISDHDKYIIKIIGDVTTFSIPIDKSMIARHLYSFSLDEVREQTGKGVVFIRSVDISYSISCHNKRSMSVLLKIDNHGMFPIVELDLKDTKLLPTMHLKNTYGDCND